VAPKPEAGSRRKAKLTSIREATAKELFGQKARDPTQELLVVEYLADGDAAGRLTFDKPNGRAVDEGTALGRFLKKYGAGKLPALGTEIQLLANEQGKWKPLT
jgi:hypothetical protein